MMHAQQTHSVSCESELSAKLPEYLPVGKHTKTVLRQKKLLVLENLQWTATVDSQEALPMEEIRKDVANIRVALAELKTDVRHILTKIEPVGRIDKDTAVINAKVGILVWFTGGILISIIGGVIAGVILLLTRLQQI